MRIFSTFSNRHKNHRDQIIILLVLLVFGLDVNSLGVGSELEETRPLGTKLATPEQMQKAQSHNLKYFKNNEKSTLDEKMWSNRREFSPIAPVAETDVFEYLIMSSDIDFDSKDFKRTIVKNLPIEMKLILVATVGSEEKVHLFFSQWISENRFEILSLPASYKGRTLWARDWIPFPVYRTQLGEIGLVGAHYDQHGPGNDVGVFKVSLAKRMHAPINERDFFFVGGNLQSNSEGHCFTVKSNRLFGLTENALKENYGCHKVTILPHLTGVGDVDEVIKLLPNRVILTNQSEYVETLENQGYRVVLLPPVKNNVSAFGFKDLGSYANSVILGNRVFVPIYGRPSDIEAISIYEKLGYQVFTADSKNLSFVGLGSFHCLTMSYPKMELQNMAKLFGASIYMRNRAHHSPPFLNPN
jgi:agmatine/peptidylarginine deiminase